MVNKMSIELYKIKKEDQNFNLPFNINYFKLYYCGKSLLLANGIGV